MCATRLRSLVCSPAAAARQRAKIGRRGTDRSQPSATRRVRRREMIDVIIIYAMRSLDRASSRSSRRCGRASGLVPRFVVACGVRPTPAAATSTRPPLGLCALRLTFAELSSRRSLGSRRWTPSDSIRRCTAVCLAPVQQHDQARWTHTGRTTGADIRGLSHSPMASSRQRSARRDRAIDATHDEQARPITDGGERVQGDCAAARASRVA